MFESSYKKSLRRLKFFQVQVCTQALSSFQNTHSRFWPVQKYFCSIIISCKKTRIFKKFSQAILKRSFQAISGYQEFLEPISRSSEFYFDDWCRNFAINSLLLYLCIKLQNISKYYYVFYAPKTEPGNCKNFARIRKEEDEW